MTARSELSHRFSHHPPLSPHTAILHAELREAALRLAEVVTLLCPAGREQSTALTKVEEAMFWGNAAIARDQR